MNGQTQEIKAALMAAQSEGRPVSVTYASGRRMQWKTCLPKRRILAIEEAPYQRYDGASLCVTFDGGAVVRIGQIIGVTA